jgi:hypothetical protein
MKAFFKDKEIEISIGRVTPKKVIAFKKLIEEMQNNSAQLEMVTYLTEKGYNFDEIQGKTTTEIAQILDIDAIKHIMDITKKLDNAESTAKNILVYCKIAQAIGYIENQDEAFTKAWKEPINDTLTDFWENQDITEVKAFAESFRDRSVI